LFKMKYFKMIFLGIVLTAFLAACGGHEGHEHDGHDHDAMQTEASEHADTLKQGNANNFTYACPMHPDQGGNEPGKCPKCGMDYEKVEKPADSSK